MSVVSGSTRGRLRIWRLGVRVPRGAPFSLFDKRNWNRELASIGSLPRRTGFSASGGLRKGIQMGRKRYAVEQIIRVPECTASELGAPEPTAATLLRPARTRNTWIHPDLLGLPASARRILLSGSLRSGAQSRGHLSATDRGVYNATPGISLAGPVPLPGDHGSSRPPSASSCQPSGRCGCCRHQNAGKWSAYSLKSLGAKVRRGRLSTSGKALEIFERPANGKAT